MKRPLLLIGQGARGFDLVPLVERLNIPVATTWNAMDMIPYDHPLCVGRPGTVSLPLANWAVQNCDYLISVGARLDNIVTCYAPETFASQARRLTVDIDEAELAKHPGDTLRADACEFLSTLDFHCPDWIKESPYGKYPKRDYPASGPISHYQLVEALSDILQEGQLIVTGSSGLAVEAFYQTFRNKRGQRIFHTTGLGAMGYGLPSAIGACLAAGRKPTVLFESDGSLMFALPSLATIARLDLPITIIVANNGGYASMRATQRNYFDGRYIATGEGIPDICKVAEQFNIVSFNYEDDPSILGIAGRLNIKQWPRLINVDLLPNEVLSPKFVSAPPLMQAAA